MTTRDYIMKIVAGSGSTQAAALITSRQQEISHSHNHNPTMVKGHELQNKPAILDAGIGHCPKAAEITTEVAKLVLTPLGRDVSALSRKI